MTKKNGFRSLEIAGGVLLIVGGIFGFSKYFVDNNFIGILISAIAFFVGVWLIGQTIE